MTQGPRSAELFERARRLLPGGVDSPVRAFAAVGGEPLFIDWGEGPYVYDADGVRYIDLVCSWGATILGHAHPVVVKAVQEAIVDGSGFGAPHERELQLAEAVRDAFPSMERVRFVSSGTEACMSAVRLARAHTGRELLVKFDGCYHGHSDGLLVQAGSGVVTLGLPDSPGVLAGAAAATLSIPFNDLDAVRRLFAKRGREIAAVIVEPVACNMGVVPPAQGFLEGLREVTTASGAILIFDEVITGFRLAPGGAQSVYGVIPDLTCLGKVIGGGLPVAAYGGWAEIMQKLAPEGPVYQAGTLSGNPVALAAGLAALEYLALPGAFERLERAAGRLAAGLREVAGTSAQVVCAGTLVGMFLSQRPVRDLITARASNTEAYGRFFRAMQDEGVYLPPSQFEGWFLTLAHDGDVVDEVVRAAGASLPRAGLPG
ncbi:MAG: glutamate-1-semialdehyde 2,1-aminomutase [Candidatus Dormibacteria bacterium]